MVHTLVLLLLTLRMLAVADGDAPGVSEGPSRFQLVARACALAGGTVKRLPALTSHWASPPRRGRSGAALSVTAAAGRSPRSGKGSMPWVEPVKSLY